MTMKSIRPPFRAPTSRPARWIAAATCAAAVATGLTIAHADLTSLQRDRDTVAVAVTEREAALHELRAANDALSAQLADSREQIAAHEHTLSARDGFLP